MSSPLNAIRRGDVKPDLWRASEPQCDKELLMFAPNSWQSKENKRAFNGRALMKLIICTACSKSTQAFSLMREICDESLQWVHLAKGAKFWTRVTRPLSLPVIERAPSVQIPHIFPWHACIPYISIQNFKQCLAGCVLWKRLTEKNGPPQYYHVLHIWHR